MGLLSLMQEQKMVLSNREGDDSMGRLKELATVFILFLMTVTVLPSARANIKDFSSLLANEPASGEGFYPTTQWKVIEPLAWNIATKVGLTGWTRRLFMIIVWNESRGKPAVIGDRGCAMGLMQIHVGGTNKKGGPCPTDNRSLLPGHLQVAREEFLNPKINLEAGAHLLLRKKGSGTAFSATARYAGCSPKSNCAKRVWSRHYWWWLTGLNKRVLKLESEERKGTQDE